MADYLKTTISDIATSRGGGNISPPSPQNLTTAWNETIPASLYRVVFVTEGGEVKYTSNWTSISKPLEDVPAYEKVFMVTQQTSSQYPATLYIPESTTASAIQEELLKSGVDFLRSGDVGISLRDSAISRGDTSSQQSSESILQNIAAYFPEMLAGTGAKVSTSLTPSGYKGIGNVTVQVQTPTTFDVQGIMGQRISQMQPDTSLKEQIGGQYGIAGEFDVTALGKGFHVFVTKGKVPEDQPPSATYPYGVSGLSDYGSNIWLEEGAFDSTLLRHEILHGINPDWSESKVREEQSKPFDIIFRSDYGKSLFPDLVPITQTPVLIEPVSSMSAETKIESFDITPISLISGLPEYGTRTAEVIGTATILPESHTVWGQKVLDVLGIETETSIKSFETKQTPLGLTVPKVEMKTVPIVKEEDIYGKGFVPAPAKEGLVGAIETFGMSAATAPVQFGVGLIGLGVTGITQGPAVAGKEFVKSQVTFAEDVLRGDPWALGFLAGSVVYGKIGQLASAEKITASPTMESIKTTSGELQAIKLGTGIEIEKGVKINLGEVLSLEGTPVLKDIKLVKEFGTPKEVKPPSLLTKIESKLTGEPLPKQPKFLELETPGADIKTVIENIGDLSRQQGEKLTFQQTFYDEKGSPVFMKTKTRIGVGEGDITLVQQVEKIGALQRTDFPDLNQNLQRIGLSSKEMFGIKEGQTLGVKSSGPTAEEIMGVSATKLAEPIFLGEKIAGVKIKASTQQLDVFRKGVVLEDVGFQELVNKYPQNLVREEAVGGGVQKLKIGAKDIFLEEGVLREKQFEALKGTETKTLIKEFETYRFTEPEKSLGTKTVKVSPMDTQSLETLKLTKQSQLIGEEFSLLKSVREPSVTFGMFGIPVVKIGEQFKITTKPLSVPEQYSISPQAIYGVGVSTASQPTATYESMFIPQVILPTSLPLEFGIVSPSKTSYLPEMSLPKELSTKQPTSQISFPTESFIPKESFSLKPQEALLPKELTIPTSRLIPNELTITQPKETTIPSELLIPAEKLIPQEILIPELITQFQPKTMPKVFTEPSALPPFFPIFPSLGGGKAKLDGGKKYRRLYKYTPTWFGIESGKRLKKTPSPYVGIQVGGIRYPAKQRINVPLFGGFDFSPRGVRKVKSKSSKREKNISKSLNNVFRSLGV